MSPDHVERIENCQRACAEVIGLLNLVSDAHTHEPDYSNGMADLARIVRGVADHLDEIVRS